MKINEVLDINQTIIILADLDTNFSSTYPRIVKLANSLIQNKEKLDSTTLLNMRNYLSQFIDRFNSQADKILNTGFSSNDKEIKNLRRKIKKMKHNVEYLKTKV